ncbi:MAG: HAMP domain-containing protein [Marinobacter sp.]|nr:HAMP domain-containing protein [Marinobacter sp.]
MTRQGRRYRIPLELLVAFTVTLGMLTLAMILLIQGYRGMSSAMVVSAEGSAQQLVTTIDDRIRSLTELPSGALRILSHDPLAEAHTLPARLSRVPALLEVLRSSDIISAAYIGYPNGDFFLLRKLNHPLLQSAYEPPAMGEYLLQIIKHKGDERLREWRFFDSDMQLLENRPMPEYQFDPRTRPWYQRALGHQDTQLTPPYIFFTTQEVGITLARQTAGGRSILGIDAAVTDLSHQFSDLRLTPSTELAIVDGQGTVIAYPDINRLLSTPGPEFRLPTLDELQVPVLARVADLPVSNQAQRFVAAGLPWYGISAPLQALHADDLRIIIAVPERELLSAAQQILVQQTALTITVTLVLLVIGWVVGRQIGKPLRQLADQVGALSRFNFHTPIGVKSRIREAEELSQALHTMSEAIRHFLAISMALNREHKLDSLLADVLEKLIALLGQKRGAIYLYDSNEKKLKREQSRWPDSPLQLEQVEGDQADIDIIQAMRRQLPGEPVLSVLRNRQRKLIGILAIDLADSEVTSRDYELIQFVDEVAGSAAVAIETRQLIESQKALLNGIIRLVADAIDAKSPYTSGHCERVPKLAQLLLDQAIQSDQPPFAHFRMTETEAEEFQIAAWLHDCGKITSPEYVVDKATKLETIYNRIHEIRTRFEVLHRDAEIRYLRALLDGEDNAAAARQRDQRLAQLQADFALVATANAGGEFMDEELVTRIEQIADYRWQRHFSDRQGVSHDELARFEGTPEPALPVEEKLLDDKPSHMTPWGDRKPPVTRDDPRNRWGFDMALPEHAYNRGELYNLTIRKGTLTAEERFRINEHIVQTICMLNALPLPEHLARVPRLAGTHHEKMDGTGYPCKLPGEALGIPEKVMVIADIFEALTAKDRPYKDGKTLSQALDIMVHMVAEGHIDPATFRLFITTGVYRQYGDQFLAPAQLDEVDEAALLAKL